jgi:cytochrome c-type biogenesis protein CcmH
MTMRARFPFFRRLALALAIVLSAAAPALAVQPDEILPDKALEQRARSLSAGLRCLVCQNQSIDDSNAALARDLRMVVRERLVAGDSDGQVMDYVVARYGEFVLLKPPVKAETLLLWTSPFVLLAIGFLWLLLRARTQRAAALTDAPALTDEERRALERALAQARGDEAPAKRG